MLKTRYLEDLIQKQLFHFHHLSVEGIDNEAVALIFSSAILSEEFCLFSNTISNGDEYFRFLHNRIIRALENKQSLPIVRFADGEYAFYRYTLGCNGLYKQAESVETIRRIMPLHITAMEYLAGHGLLAPLIFPGNSHVTVQNFLSFQKQKRDSTGAEFLDFLRTQNINLNAANYIPFYVIYAYLSSAQFAVAMNGKRICILNSEYNPERCRDWFAQFNSQPLLTFVDIPAEYVATRWEENKTEILNKFPPDTDLCLAGAGVGALLICVDVARSFSIPVIDAGHVLNMMNSRVDKSNGARLYTLRKKRMNDLLKKYRHQYRIWKNNRRLQREKEYYNRIFTQRGLTILDEQALWQELHKIFPHVAAKTKGKLSIIALYHYYNWENAALKPSLEAFGHVRHYDWFEKFSHQSKYWRNSLKAAMNEDLIRQINTWLAEEKADVIFAYLSGELVEPAKLQAIRSHGIPLINLALNDKEHFVGKIRSGRAFGSRDICRYFDLCWTSTEDAVIKYCVEDARPIYLPEGANPQIHKPYAIEKIIDVSFVGQCYGNRRAVITELQNRGIAVKAYGTGWPDGPLTTEEMVKMYSKTKINLGFGGVSGYKDTFCLKGRDFEIPMSGGLYLTEAHPELSNVFRSGKEILTYSGIDDLVAQIKYYLANPAEAQSIRKKRL